MTLTLIVSSPPPTSSALVLSTSLVVEACGIVGRASLSFASDVLGEGGSVVIIATRPRPLRRSPRPRRRAPSHSPSTGVFDGDLGDHMERPRQVRAWSPCLAGCGSGLCSKGGSYLLAPAVVLALQCVLRCVPVPRSPAPPLGAVNAARVRASVWTGSFEVLVIDGRPYP